MQLLIQTARYSTIEAATVLLFAVTMHGSKCVCLEWISMKQNCLIFGVKIVRSYVLQSEFGSL